MVIILEKAVSKRKKNFVYSQFRFNLGAFHEKSCIFRKCRHQIILSSFDFSLLKFPTWNLPY
jgi:hypothetical protein